MSAFEPLKRALLFFTGTVLTQDGFKSVHGDSAAAHTREDNFNSGVKEKSMERGRVLNRQSPILVLVIPAHVCHDVVEQFISISCAGY